MTKLLPVAVLLSVAYPQGSAHSQPEVDPNAPQTYSIAELERLLNGRTLLSINVKDASIQEITAAMSRSSGLKIAAPAVNPGWETDSVSARYMLIGGEAYSDTKPFPPNATFTLAAQDQPFWEALRNWHTTARHAATIPNAKTPVNSFGLLQMDDTWQTIPGNWLAQGRAVSAWPFLVIATDLQRAQAARLGRIGLREPEQPHDALATLKRNSAPAPAPPATEPLPEEKLWSDQLILSAYALPDPKLFPTDLSCEVTEAVDDKGNDLRVPYGVTMQSRESGTVELGKGSPLQIALASKPGMGKKITRLRGVLRFSIITRTHHWETTDLTKPVDNTLREGGDEFKIGFTGMTQKGNTWDFNFEAQSQGKHLEQFFKNTVGPNNGGTGGVWGLAGISSMQVVDANGRQFEALPDEALYAFGRRHTPDVITPKHTMPDDSPLPADLAEHWMYRELHRLAFQQPTAGLETGGPVGPPVKLSIDFAVDRRQVEVPFEFTDLPLPPS